MSSESSIRKNTAYNIIKTASTILFPLITFPYISRVLQPENVGKINFGHSIVSYFSMFATLGVTTYAVRECAKAKTNKAKLETVASQILSINLLTTILSYFFLALFLCLSERLHNYRLLIVVQSMSIVFSTFGADWLNTAMEDFKYITIRTVAFQGISLILMFIFVRQAEDYMKYAGITVLSSSGASIMNILYRRRYCRTRIIKKLDLKRHLPPILGLFAMLIAQQVFTLCDTTIIGLTLGDFEVGLYSTAVKVYNIVAQVINSITWVVMPQLSLAFSENNIPEVKRILTYVLQFTTILGLPCVVGIFLLNREIILLVSGKSYLGASTVMRLLAIALAVVFVGNFVLNVNLLAAGKDKVCLLACAIASMLNVITNFWTIPIYGINAAAVTTIISQSTVALICIPFLNKKLQLFKMLKVIRQPLLASAGLTVMVVLVCRFCDDLLARVSLSVALGAGVYFGLLVFMKNEFIMKAIYGMRKKFG